MGFTMLLLGTQAQATLILTADSPSLIPGPACEDTTACGENNTKDIRTFIEDEYSVLELYKSEVDDGESGAFAGFYDTSFSNSLEGSSDALITFTGDEGESINCPDCYLLVKDGNHEPAWYLFDIGIWKGAVDIYLTGFRPDNGTASHIAIYGAERNIPEPGTLALLGLGLAFMGVTRRKVK